MSVSTRIEAIEQHLTDDYSILEVAGADLTNVDKNIVNLKLTWQERLLYFINNGTDIVWNNWEKVEGTGETLTLNSTEEAPMKIDLKGNTSQEGTPTPETPQDIHVVSGDNEIKVQNKNLTLKNVKGYFGSNSILIDNGSESFVFYATQGETYTFSSQTAMNRGQYAKVETLNIVNNTPISNKTSISVASSYNSATFTCSFTGYCIVYVNSTANNAIAETFQIEVGTTSTTYVEHKGYTKEINLGNIELCKIGDYQDSIVKDNGKWYLNKQIGKVVLNGSENWNMASSIASGTTRFNYQNNDVFNSKIEGDLSIYVASCSFKGISWQGMYYDNTTTKNAISNYTSSNITVGRIQIRINNTIANDVSTFKTWLSAHNTKVYYVLATPTTTQITDTTLISQLDTIKRSYDEQTNITQVNNDLPFILDVTALKELTQ